MRKIIILNLKKKPLELHKLTLKEQLIYNFNYNLINIICTKPYKQILINTMRMLHYEKDIYTRNKKHKHISKK